MCCCMIERSSVPPRKSLATFRNLWQICSESVRKMFGNVRQAFGTILENLRKSSENCQKRRY